MLALCVAALLVQPPVTASSQDQEGSRRERRSEKADDLKLDQGLIEFDTPELKLTLVKASQTIAALEPKGADGFDFTPFDQLEARSPNGFHHLGDLTLGTRKAGSDEWQSYSTAATRQPVKALRASNNVLAAADLSATLPSDCPVGVSRSWLLEDGQLALRFVISNRIDEAVEIGALGLPVVFNNMIHNFVTGRPRTLEEAHKVCSFADPYVGMDGGYLQVTRLSGKGPALVVVPDGKTPFENYHLLREPIRPMQTFEGAFEWMVHTTAYAENEWLGVEQWNTPTMATLAPGETKTVGLRFLVVPEIRQIEDTLAAANRPVAVGIPGYILPMDLDARLFLNYGEAVKSIEVKPRGAIKIREDEPTLNGWKAYTLRGKEWGRARLTITYADGLVQTIHYTVIRPAAEALDDLGNFLFTRQWYVNPDDPFGRSPSVMSYDREADRIVEQDSRVWIAGLGDEGGSGSWLAAAIKLFGRPDKQQIAQYQQFIDEILWGGLQYDEGDLKYGVRKSLLYYTTNAIPDFEYDTNLDWTSWASWSEQHARSIGRGYNYPHVVAAYWSFYRLARNNSKLVTNRSWDWYLNQAYETSMFLTSKRADGRYRVGYVDKGLMEGDIFLMVLEDLKREGWTDKAEQLEARMKERVDRWIQHPYPFGSEMAWDSTGQEEVFAWCKYFGLEDKALVSLNSILGYMPTVPHWGYNGNARRYWDFLYAAAPGLTSRIERQIHHYGSGLNAIPLLTQYREHPDDFHLLRVGYAGTMGALSSIDQDGFASAAFHSFPSTLKWDAYSGDYGPNLFGHAVNTATYVVNHPEFGWVAFGGNVKVSRNRVKIEPQDSFRKRVYLAPQGLWLTLDAGTFDRVELDLASGAVRIGLTGRTASTPEARLRVEQLFQSSELGKFRPTGAYSAERDAFVIPLRRGTTWVDFTQVEED